MDQPHIRPSMRPHSAIKNQSHEVVVLQQHQCIHYEALPQASLPYLQPQQSG